MFKHFFIQSLYFLSATIALLSGCTKDVTNIKLPETNSKLVVGCFISPKDTVIVVTLSRSNPIFGPNHNNNSNNLLVTDASVTISDDAASVTVPYNSANERYELQSGLFPIMPAQTYSLTISTPKGESVSASCTVPISNLTSLTVDFIDTTITNPNDYLRINVKWQDIPNQTNYYRAYGEIILIDPFPSSNNDTVPYEMYAPKSVLNDNEKDGKDMAASLEGYIPYGIDNGVQQTVKIIAYDIYLLNIDAEYYKYQYSLDHYSYGGDPFSEPSPLYTNIKGGLGIFAAYQKLYMRFP